MGHSNRIGLHLDWRNDFVSPGDMIMSTVLAPVAVCVWKLDPINITFANWDNWRGRELSELIVANSRIYALGSGRLNSPRAPEVPTAVWICMLTSILPLRCPSAIPATRLRKRTLWTWTD